MAVITIDAPAWDLLINGRQLPRDRRPFVRSISVEATIDGADELTIEVDAFDSAQRKYIFLGEDLLAVGNQVVPRFGYGNELLGLQRFYLVREEGHFPDGGTPTATIRGYSFEHYLAEGKAPRVFPASMTDADIAKALAAEYGLTVTSSSVETTGRRQSGRVKEKGKSDLEFLQGLAAANGFGPPVIRWDEKTGQEVLHFRTQSLANQDSKATFVYDVWAAGSDLQAGNLLSFDPVMNLAGVPTKIEITGHDKARQEDFVVVVEITDSGQKSTLFSGDQIKALRAPKSGAQHKSANKKAATKENVPQVKLTTVDDALAFAKLWLKTRNEAYMTARARTVGWNGLWVGQVHEFTGLPTTYNGLWELLQVSHRMDEGGYSCELDLARVMTEAAEPKESS